MLLSHFPDGEYTPILESTDSLGGERILKMQWKDRAGATQTGPGRCSRTDATLPGPKAPESYQDLVIVGASAHSHFGGNGGKEERFGRFLESDQEKAGGTNCGHEGQERSEAAPRCVGIRDTTEWGREQDRGGGSLGRWQNGEVGVDRAGAGS